MSLPEPAKRRPVVDLPPDDWDGLAWGLHIHRHYDKADWRAVLSKAPEHAKKKAIEYLSGIAVRLEALAKIKGTNNK